MSMLIPPQMINTMDEADLSADPVRRYMAPAYSEREPSGRATPLATRDSLHEADMWAVEGLTHRYPTKVLAELIRRARSTAATARGWTLSATTRCRSSSTSSR
jgi:lysine 2,3-aminomutase